MWYAIVLDADETVLDNSAFEAGLIGTGNSYSNATRDEWCAAAKATAMPGATEYLQAVDKMGGRNLLCHEPQHGKPV